MRPLNYLKQADKVSLILIRMIDTYNGNRFSSSKLISVLLGFPWLEIVAETWQLGRKIWRGLAEEGMYEVLEYEAVYDLKDIQGKNTHFSKRQRVRYLQNNIISYLDQAWGDGEILLNYQCSPGTEADRYRLGHKTYILISLRDVKQRGDEDEFQIEWDMTDTFTRTSEQCEAEVSHRTKHLSIQVIFPKERPPLQAALVENTRRKTHLLKQEDIKRLPNGRWRIKWECKKPRLYERYILKWEW